MSSAKRGWFLSSYSNGDNTCVEVQSTDSAVLVRDTKYQGNPASQPTITLTPDEWSAVLDAAAHGSQPASPILTRTADGGAAISHNGTDLTYTPAEWDAFRAGAIDGEFTYAPAVLVS